MAETDLQERMEALGAKVVPLRDKKGMKWEEIMEKTGETAGHVMLAYLFVTEKPHRIKARTDEELAKKVAKARQNEKLSWGVLSARSGKPESWCRTAFQQETGHDHRGDRIGKGGRFPGANGTATRTKSTTKKARAAEIAKKAKAKAGKKAKKTTKKATKAATKSRPKPGGTATAKTKLADLTLGELKDKLNGKRIAVKDDGDRIEMSVDRVTGLKDGQVKVVDDGGDNRTFPVDDVVGIHK